MKRVYPVISLLIIFLSLHCYNDAERDNPNDPDNFGLEYPNNCMYGENLLKAGTVSVSTGTNYSLCIRKTGNNRARVVVPLNASFNWLYSLMPDPVIGWIITSENASRVLIADGPWSFDVKLYFTSPAAGGYGEIKIYEDESGTPARSVILSW